MSSKNDVRLGLFIVIAGVVILLGKLGVFGFLGRTLWPFAIIIVGLLLHLLFFSKRARAYVLIPGGALVVYGLMFAICNFWGFGLMTYLWPVFLLGIAVGVYEYHMFESPKPEGVLLIALFLGIVSFVLLFFTLLHTGAIYVLAVLLIALGIWFIAGKGRSRGNKWNRGW
ncbi:MULTISPECIES: hypothetical protein [Paenibacillus]|uniref:DUF5668 domain-containing protein n=1 Tax=Paenibacillus albilobatus TaxID=2716884 RepID=A0A919XGS6_9BACL|nr:MULTISPECIES: hypothetical protein [Paenibacillus]MDR9853027.1 hypothetical protein [Paenibacillus sp. VCA1]GIO30517.1 hypothetical protein J2TS6_16580 [Paenibacillus albilobatus]